MRLDFTELPEDGTAFEQLIRELLFSLGLHVEWSGRGPDGGRDLICRETVAGIFTPQTRTWLVQCKHKAHSGNSVGKNDLDDIVDSCVQHGATGYLLACSTYPSSAVVNRLDGVTANPKNDITAFCWDGVMLERLLSRPRQWAIAQRFMPRSSGAWRIYATEAPNDFVAHYRGYVFHLSNRVGSQVGHQLQSIEARMAEIEAIDLPEDHFIRPRAVWYDDKNGGYTWYIDYMRPEESRPAISREELKETLKDGWALEDGQIYHWDVHFVRYRSWSDHYDRDHYNYYTRYLPNFLGGAPREHDSDREEYWATEQELTVFEEAQATLPTADFEAMVATLERLPFLRLVRAVNCNPEILWKMERRFDWSDLLEEFDADVDNILSATLIVEVRDEARFFEFLSLLPNDVDQHFRASRVYIFLPNVGLDSKDDEMLFDVRLRLHPQQITNQRTARDCFNAYYRAIRAVAERMAPFPEAGTPDADATEATSG